MGRHGRPLPGRGAQDAPRHPADLRRRLRARPRQPARRDGVPAQHRPRRDARSRTSSARRRTSPRRRRARAARSGRSRRASAPPARTAGAAPTRASARTPGSSSRWRPRSTASRAGAASSTTPTGCSPPPSTTRATATPSTGPRPATTRSTRASRSPAAPTSGSNSLRQYLPAVQKHHVGSVMPSFSSVDWTEDGVGNPLKMHAHRELITDVLKRGMGFGGFVISDWEADPPARRRPGRRRSSHSRQRGRRHVHGAQRRRRHRSRRSLESSRRRCSRRSTRTAGSRRARIDDAVSRILKQEVRARAVRAPLHGPPPHRRDRLARAPRRRAPRGRQVAGAAQEQAARAAAAPPRQASTWPAPTPTTSATRPAAGRSPGRAARRNVIPGDTILDGIRTPRARAAASPTARTPRRRSAAATSASWSSARRRTPRASATSAARGGASTPATNGVLRPPQTMQLNDADKAAVDKVCAEARKCVVVVVSGRPLIIDPAQLSQIDGLVAAWLPGSEGSGRGRHAVRHAGRTPAGCR